MVEFLGVILSEVDRKKTQVFCVCLVTSLFDVCQLYLNGNDQVANLHLGSHSESSSSVIYRLEGMKCD